MPSFLKLREGLFERDVEISGSQDMFDDVGCLAKGKPGPEFLPFTCSVLPKSLIEYAAKQLNETEETRTKGLIEIREFLKTELHVRFEVKDEILLCFLRSRKFDVKKTATLLRKGSEFIDSHRPIFDRVDSETVVRTIQSKTVGFLPYRDSKGRAIVFIRSECWNPNEMKAEDIIFGSIVALHSYAENPLNQVAGYVVILDFKNLSVHQIVAISSWLVFGIQALQHCLPCLVKEFHITHTPGIFRYAWKIVKPLLSEKIKKRIIFYKSTHWESLHRRIPPAILPEELGGQLGPYSYEHWASDIPNMERDYTEKMRMFIDRKKPL